MKIKKYIEQSPVFAFTYSYSKVLRKLNEELGKDKLNFLQALVLIAVVFEKSEDVHPSQLAEVFETARGNISHCITHLERLGLLSRQLNSKDARSYKILVRPEGKKKALKLIRFFDELQGVFEREMGVHSIRTIISGMRKMEHCYSEFRAH